LFFVAELKGIELSIEEREPGNLLDGQLAAVEDE